MSRNFTMLLVEDDQDDVELVQEALKQSQLGINLSVAEDGGKALAYLRREAPYAEALRPDLILLDLNMPGKDGREVLQEIKNDATLKSIPVVILTTSMAPDDIRKSYSLGANCFITKPAGFEELNKMIRLLEEFWFTLVKLPPKP